MGHQLMAFESSCNVTETHVIIKIWYQYVVRVTMSRWCVQEKGGKTNSKYEALPAHCLKDMQRIVNEKKVGVPKWQMGCIENNQYQGCGVSLETGQQAVGLQFSCRF